MRRLLMILGLVSLVAIGCGDGSSSSSSDDAIAQADQLCKDAQAEQQKLLDSSDSNSTNPKVMTKYLDSSLTRTEDLNSQLGKLTPPADQKKEWNAWIDAQAAQEKLTKRLVGTVKGGVSTAKNSPYVKALNDVIAGQVETNKLASGLGLTSCSQNTAI